MAGLIYTRYDITTLSADLALLRWETNDDNDDGQPDPEVAVLSWTMTMARARELAGVSHTGAHGQPVEVYLDGCRI